MSGKIAKQIAISSSIGAGIGILASAVLIFIMAAILTIGDIPAMMISPVTSVLMAFGSFCGGFCGAKIAGEKGFICGMLTGLITFIVVCISGGIIGEFGIGMPAFIKGAMLVIASAFGGVIGVNYIKK